MKRIVFFLSFIVTAGSLKAQSNSGQDISTRIANKMRDTLSLSQVQRDSIYQINVRLHNQKQMVRQQYQNIDSVRIKTQGAENTRDSLYRPVLTSSQYDLYRQKKRTLVSAN